MKTHAREFITQPFHFRLIVVVLASLLLAVFAFFQNGGETNAQSRSKLVDNVILAPQSNSWVNNQNASVVLGQAVFTTNSTGTGLNQMRYPYGVAVDAATGKVFVADLNNNRVLRFTSAAAMTNGSTAEAVFGGTGAVAANTMSAPNGVTMDPSGNLWVVDFHNSRVLRFGGAAALASGSSADRVLGQALFTTSAAPDPPTASSMNLPNGVFADPGGALWVSDTSNRRVLRFDSAATLASGAAANGVLGQPGFITNAWATTQSGMMAPAGLTVDSGGRLWVGDYSNARVLRFDAAATLANGANASGVLGQTLFTTRSCNLSTPGCIGYPVGVSVDSSGRLYVADGFNHRVLIFNAAATKANGANADNVLGQPGFTTNTTNAASASSLNYPAHLFFDNTSQNLFVTDYINSRVLRFAPVGVSTFRRLFDFDGDGKSDLSIFRPGPGEWWYNKSSNGGNAAAAFGTSTDKIAPGDYTGDGKNDFAFFRPSTGQWFILRSEDSSFYAFPFGTPTDVPAPADYDGDGKTDAAVYRPSTTTWFIFRSSDNGATIATFGMAGDVPVAADYDGDGKADIATYRPSLGQWWIYRSATDTATFYAFGSSTDRCVPGDYTGDGRADVAFWRPSTGEWFIVRSEDSSYYSFPYGANGDVPSPGDYDGDGKFDAAVFRPSTSTWFAKRSTAGTLIQQFGQAGDIAVPNAFVR